MNRDFRAEAIARKKQDKEAEAHARRYQINPRPYQFITRPPDLTDEEWRSLTEARWLILALQTPEQRRLYLAGVERQRGTQARKALEQKAKEIWQQTRT